MPPIHVRREAWSESSTPKEHSSNSFYKEVRPILLIMRAFGRFPYGMTDKGILPFSLWSIPAVYCFAAYACIFCFSVNTMRILIHESFWKTKTYYEKLTIFILISFLSHNFVVPITFWLPAPRLVKYIERWSRCESDFKNEFKKLRFPLYVKYLSIMAIPAALVHVCLVVWILLESSVCMTAVFYPVTLVSYMSMILWFASLLELQLQAKALRRNIFQEERLSDLDNKRRYWAALSYLASETGYCQGTACGYLSLSAFVSYLISIYLFISGIILSTDEVNVQFHVVVPLLFYSLFFYSMFDIGESTSKEIGTKFIETIMEIRETKHDLEDDNDELSLFLRTMKVGQPKLTFMGFVVVNRGLIRSLISNTVTFLLVLIQFKN